MISSTSDPGQRTSSWQGVRCRPVVGRSLEYHSGDRMIQLNFPPILRRTPWEGQGPPTSLPHPPTSREDLRLEVYP
ncbi:hypothetical protein TNCV_4010701 [Trichonephila clavipes]|nr:hypothetical protein TNCV_4010701 [Trichonephila clavipes]